MLRSTFLYLQDVLDYRGLGKTTVKRCGTYDIKF